MKPEIKNKVSIDDLASERLTPKLKRAIDQFQILLVIQHNDEHVALKADNTGIHLNSMVRFRGLGAILFGIAGTVLALFIR